MATHGHVMEPLLGKTFEELSGKEQSLFLDARIEVVFMQDYEHRTLCNVFALMNAQKNLTPAEKVLSQSTVMVEIARELYTVYADGIGKQARVNQDGIWILGLTELLALGIDSTLDLGGKVFRRVLATSSDEASIDASRDKVSEFMQYMTSVIDATTTERSVFLKLYKVRIFAVLFHIWLERGGFAVSPEQFQPVYEDVVTDLVENDHYGTKLSDLPRYPGRQQYAKFILEGFAKAGINL